MRPQSSAGESLDLLGDSEPYPRDGPDSGTSAPAGSDDPGGLAGTQTDSRGAADGTGDGAREGTGITSTFAPADHTQVAGAGFPEHPSIPGYEIRGILGEGGMGVVYRALQSRANRLVALKMIRRDAHVRPEHLRRFRSEAQAVARLRHPNVVQIFDVAEVAGLPYFSLELLEGGTLKARLAEAPLAIRPAAELIMVLAGAVHSAHQAGIVHRDLKPTNILFDLDGTPKITDFGLAKRLEVEEGQTITGQVLGTPSYMAPEQASGNNREVGPSADVYALGAILYEVLTGRAPFRGTNASETLQMVISQDPVPPSRLQPGLPRDLETICLKCLAKVPTRRYDTALELAADLGRYLGGRPIHARPAPALERAVKWAKRRPATASLSAVGLLAVLGLAWAYVQYEAAARTQRQEERRHDTAVRLETAAELTRGQGLAAGGQLDEARLALSKLAEKLRPETRLPELYDAVREELRGVEVRANDLERLSSFRRLRDDALFRDAQFVGPGSDPDQARLTRTAARAALAVFAPPGGDEAGRLTRLPAWFTPEQQDEVDSGCYLMLMVLSEAIARPLPGEAAPHQAGEALRVLDRAALSRSTTLAYCLRRASCLDRLGETDKARHLREQAARLTPSGAFDYLLLGQECSRRGDWRAARSHFEKAIQKQQDLFWAHCLLAIAELNSRPPRAAEARAEFTTCLIQQPTYAWLYLLRGFANGQMGQALAIASARSVEDRALAAEAEARFEEAEADIRKAEALGLGEDLRFVLLMNRGTMRFQMGRFDEAAADFRQAIGRNGTDHNAYASLAEALRRLGRRDEAVAQFGKAIAREPGLAALHRGRAMARLDGKDVPMAELEAALRDLERSASLEPARSREAANDHLIRAGRLFGLDRFADALAAADAALAIAADLADAHLIRVDALLGLERFDEAIAASDLALSRGCRAAGLYRLRGLARVGRGEISAAIDDYNRALAIDPARKDVHRDRGFAYLFAGAPELALLDFDEAIRSDATDSHAYAGRAAARIRLGKIREALADCDASLRRGAEVPRILYLGAQTQAQAAEMTRRGRAPTPISLGHERRATKLLSRALEETPPSKRAAFWRKVVLGDVRLSPLLRNPRLRSQFESIVARAPELRSAAALVADGSRSPAGASSVAVQSGRQPREEAGR